MIRRGGRWAVALFAVVGGAACGGALAEGADPRFVGRWKLTAEGGIDSSEVWELRADGTSAPIARDPRTPILVTRRDSVACTFGERWSSLDPTHLRMALQCSDDVARSGTVAFSGDPGGENASAEIEVVSVDGATDWEHRGTGLVLRMHRLP